MTDYIFPPGLRIASATMGYADVTSTFQNPFTGLTRTVARAGAPWRMQLDLRTLNSSDRTRFMGWLASMRGAANRVYVPVPGYTQRGSFPATELLTNNYFSSGTTGWTAQQSTLSSADQALRFKPTRAGASPGVLQNSFTFVQYAPYCGRGISALQSNRGSNVTTFLSDGTVATSSASTTPALRSVTQTVIATSGSFYPAYISDTTFDVNDEVDVYWSSLARCMLVDNAPNAFTYSDQIDNAAWTKNAVTVTANDGTAPDGTSTADSIKDSVTNTQHYVQQSTSGTTSAADYCTGGYFKRVTATAINVRLTVGSTGAGNYGEAYFTLSGSGSTSNVAVGGTATNARAFIQDAGNGWYYCCVVARLPSGLTNAPLIQLLSGTTATYAGTGSDGVYGWRLFTAQSSVPVRGAQTTSTAAASGTSQTGTALYVKGLPASTSGLLLPGDFVEINGGELHMVASPLRSDAAGLGYLQLSRAVRTSPSDNGPVIVNTPMAKMILNSDQQGWNTQPGIFSDSTVTFDEAA